MADFIENSIDSDKLSDGTGNDFQQLKNTAESGVDAVQNAKDLADKVKHPKSNGNNNSGSANNNQGKGNSHQNGNGSQNNGGNQNAQKNNGGSTSPSKASSPTEKGGADAAKEGAAEGGKGAAEGGSSLSNASNAAQTGEKAAEAAKTASEGAKAASAAAEGAAAGSETGPGAIITAAVALAWEEKDNVAIGAVLAIVFSMFIFILIGSMICALPTVVTNKIFGLNGGKDKPSLEMQVTEEYEKVEKEINKIITSGYDLAIEWIKEDINKLDKNAEYDIPSFNLSKSDVYDILAQEDTVYYIDEYNYIVINDKSLASRANFNPALVMAIYSASLYNTPHDIGDDRTEEMVVEETEVFKGTHLKDMKKKLKKKKYKEMMFDASKYGCSVTEETITIQVPVPTEYEAWTLRTVDVNENGTKVTRQYYFPPEEISVTEEEKTYAWCDPADMIVVSGWPSGLHVVVPKDKVQWKTVVPETKDEERIVRQFMYTIPAFDENSVYQAFNCDPFMKYQSLAADGETPEVHYMYEIVSDLQANILQTVGKSAADYTPLKTVEKISGKLISINGVVWYLFYEIKDLEQRDEMVEYKDNFLQTDDAFRRRSVTPDVFKKYFDPTSINDWEYGNAITRVDVASVGKLLVKYSYIPEDGTTADAEIRTAYLYSEEYYNLSSSTFISPLAQYGRNVEIRSWYGGRNPIDGRTSNFHGGIDFGASGGASSLGLEITAVSGGTVVLAGWTDYGNTVVIQHNINGTLINSLYGHMVNEQNPTENNNRASSPPYVSVGQTVSQGDVVGHIGKTYGPNGYATGPHLHFEIRIASYEGDPWGTKVDPSAYIDFTSGIHRDST